MRSPRHEGGQEKALFTRLVRRIFHYLDIVYKYLTFNRTTVLLKLKY